MDVFTLKYYHFNNNNNNNNNNNTCPHVWHVPEWIPYSAELHSLLVWSGFNRQLLCWVVSRNRQYTHTHTHTHIHHTHIHHTHTHTHAHKYIMEYTCLNIFPPWMRFSPINLGVVSIVLNGMSFAITLQICRCLGKQEFQDPTVDSEGMWFLDHQIWSMQRMNGWMAWVWAHTHAIDLFILRILHIQWSGKHIPSVLTVGSWELLFTQTLAMWLHPKSDNTFSFRAMAVPTFIPPLALSIHPYPLHPVVCKIDVQYINSHVSIQGMTIIRNCFSRSIACLKLIMLIVNSYYVCFSM